jgi:hypothetical protein
LIALPPTFMLLTMLSDDAAWVFGLIWFICALFCLGWGIRWVRARRRLGWGCIAYALLQFALLSLPFFLPPRVPHK